MSEPTEAIIAEASDDDITEPLVAEIKDEEELIIPDSSAPIAAEDEASETLTSSPANLIDFPSSLLKVKTVSFLSPATTESIAKSNLGFPISSIDADGKSFKPFYHLHQILFHPNHLQLKNLHFQLQLVNL